MYRSSRYLVWSGILVFCLISMCSPGITNAQAWRQYSDIEKAGWSAEKLEGARKHAASIGSGAVMIVDRGNVVAAWGHVDHPYKAASIRKSIYDATFGAAHHKKKFDVNATLESLNIDDIGILSETEKTATFEELMAARSGVYHPAAYETASNAARRPARGAHEPGAFWYYNNWDYNITTAAFEKAAGRSFNDAFETDIAGPLGFEDFRKDHIFEWLEPRSSKYPAVTFRLSARDLARIGKLYLQNGKWNKKRIVPSKWIKRSTTPLTVFEEGHYRGEGNGYGRMWWLFPARPETGSPYQSHLRIAARGTGGQIMVLFPGLDLLIVHLADTDTGRGVRDSDGTKLMDMILAARRSGKTKGKLGPVKTERLSDKDPQSLRDDFSPVPAEKLTALEGTYMFNESVGMTLYIYEQRMFLRPIGMPFPDAEAFQVRDGSLRNPLVDLIVTPIYDRDKKVSEILMKFRGQTMKGTRKDE